MKNDLENWERWQAFSIQIKVLDSARRKVKIIRTIQNCVKEDTKFYSRYADRFYGHAQAYLDISGRTEDRQENQAFAMVMLDNSYLSTITFNNLVSTLIAAAIQKPPSTEKYHQISSTKCSVLKGIWTKLMALTNDQGTNEADATSETALTKLNTQEIT